MNIQVIRPSELTTYLQDAWVSIQETNPLFENPSFSPEFTLTTAKVRNDVEIGVIEMGDEPVGFFPFHRGRKNSGEPVGSLLSEFQGVILKQGIHIDAADLLKACNLNNWYFDHLIAEQPLFQPFQLVIEPSPYMDISRGYDAYIDERRGLGFSSIKDALRKRRKFEREIGPTRFEFSNRDAETFDLLLKWKREQVRMQGFSDIFRHEWVRNLMFEAWQTNTDNFAGQLSTLHVGDELIAVILCIRGKDIINAWIPTFNPEFSRYSPGLILHLELAEFAAAAGYKSIELGRGENRMKTGLMNGQRDVALGAVDLRPVSRSITSLWYGAREIAHSKYMRGWPLKSARKIKNLIEQSNKRLYR
ncbi:MAG: GNAT family N-acetyltransferase [Pseudomonadota bacterium]